MPESAFLLFRSPEGRRHASRIAAAVIILAIGSAAIGDVWLRALSANGYRLPDAFAVVFARLEAGSWRTFAMVALAGPFMEELLFRAGLQRVLLWFYRPVGAVIAGAVVFACAHGNWAQFVPALWMGLVTGVIFARTGSFSLCFLWHATYNAQFVFPWTGLRIEGPSAVGFEYTSVQAGAFAVRMCLVMLGLRLLWSALAALPAEYRPTWAPVGQAGGSVAGPVDALST